MKWKQARLWVALVAAIGLIVASVGVASASTRQGSSAPGVTKDTINVAAMVSKPTFAASVEGAQARFDRENENGGVFGRKIEIVDTADDKFDPTTNVQEARRVVSSGDVFAIVPTAMRQRMLAAGARFHPWTPRALEPRAWVEEVDTEQAANRRVDARLVIPSKDS